MTLAFLLAMFTPRMQQTCFRAHLQHPRPVQRPLHQWKVRLGGHKCCKLLEVSSVNLKHPAKNALSLKSSWLVHCFFWHHDEPLWLCHYDLHLIKFYASFMQEGAGEMYTAPLRFLHLWLHPELIPDLLLLASGDCRITVILASLLWWGHKERYWLLHCACIILFWVSLLCP